MLGLIDGTLALGTLVLLVGIGGELVGLLDCGGVVGVAGGLGLAAVVLGDRNTCDCSAFNSSGVNYPVAV